MCMPWWVRKIGQSTLCDRRRNPSPNGDFAVPGERDLNRRPRLRIVIHIMAQLTYVQVARCPGEANQPVDWIVKAHRKRLLSSNQLSNSPSFQPL